MRRLVATDLSSRSSWATPSAACRLVMRKFQPSSSCTKRCSGLEAQIAQAAAALRQRVVVGDHHAAFAGGDVLVGVEAEGADVRRSCRRAGPVGLADAFRRRPR